MLITAVRRAPSFKKMSKTNRKDVQEGSHSKVTLDASMEVIKI